MDAALVGRRNTWEYRTLHTRLRHVVCVGHARKGWGGGRLRCRLGLAFLGLGSLDGGGHGAVGGHLLRAVAGT